MRDPNRIDGILERLRVVWTKSPDLRLGQLLLNVNRGDIYHTEDNALIEAVEELYSEKD